MSAPADEHEHDSPLTDSVLVEYTHHVNHPPVTAEVDHQCAALKEAIAQEQIYKDNKEEADEFMTTQNLHRYLRARNFDLPKSKKLMLETLSWRLSYKPDSIRASEVESECVTGKIRVLPELDRHHRPIIVMDSSRENTKGHDSQLRHLVWQLVRAERKMNQPIPAGTVSADGTTSSVVHIPPPVEKYCLFVNMERHSIWNSPPLKTSLETLKTLTDRFPEHLGHAIVFKPGMLFAGLWAACKPIMDQKTVRKVIFIRGDVSDGSKNDLKLKEVIGDNWRALCDRQKADYDHAAFWPQVLADEAAYNQAHENNKQKAQEPAALSAEAAPVTAEPAAAQTPAASPQ